MPVTNILSQPAAIQRIKDYYTGEISSAGSEYNCYSVVAQALRNKATDQSRIDIILYGIDKDRIAHVAVKIDGKMYNSQSAAGWNSDNIYPYKTVVSANKIIR